MIYIFSGGQVAIYIRVDAKRKLEFASREKDYVFESIDSLFSVQKKKGEEEKKWLRLTKAIVKSLPTEELVKEYLEWQCGELGLKLQKRVTTDEFRRIHSE